VIGFVRPWLLGAFSALSLSLPGLAQAQAVKWEPEFRFPGTLFPAFAISFAGLDEKGPVDVPQAYGYLGSGELGVKITQAPAGALIKVQIEVPEIGASGDIEATAPSLGSSKVIFSMNSVSRSPSHMTLAPPSRE
jgi:hypothetical protein